MYYKKYYLVALFSSCMYSMQQVKKEHPKLDLFKYTTINAYDPKYAHLHINSDENKKLRDFFAKHTLLGDLNLKCIILDYIGPEKIELHILTTPKLKVESRGFYHADSMSFGYDASCLPWLIVHVISTHGQEGFIKWHAITGACFGAKSIGKFKARAIKDSVDEKQAQEITAQTKDGIYHALLKRPKFFVPLRQLKATICIDQTVLLKAVVNVKSQTKKKQQSKQIIRQPKIETAQRLCQWWHQ